MIKKIKNNLYNKKFNKFLAEYQSFSYKELLIQKQRLEEDISFNDENPYNEKMLKLINSEIRKREQPMN